VTSIKTDLCFTVSNPSWLNPDVVSTNPTITQNVPNSILVTVRNCGPNSAFNFQVKVGVYVFGNSNAMYNICTIAVPFLASGGSTTLIPCAWTPTQNPGTGVVHACLKAEIVYPYDLSPANNFAQHNINIQHASTATFKMLVENPLEQDVMINLRDDFDSTTGWVFWKSEDNFAMPAHSCSRVVQFRLTSPPSAHIGDSMKVNVAIVGVVGGTESIELGGVGLIAVVSCHCGDANSDGSIDISDVVFLIAHIFSGGVAPAYCNYAKGKGDANGDGSVDISDAVYLIARIFSGGAPPHCQGE
jgi:hypothetical protein